MENYYHQFHIPVMGTGHSIDTPIRVAPFGISSVISLVDDLLLEKIRQYYCKTYNLPYENIPRTAEDGRAKRITAYLEMVNTIVHNKMERLKAQPFFEKNEKTTYFELLPEESPLKKAYHQMVKMKDSPERAYLAEQLTRMMKPGSIDVNIMVKLDKINRNASGKPLSDQYSDAKAALRGFANSSLRSSVVFSAGINKGLFNYATQFEDFYRDSFGELKKKIILKVSDFRSALIQGKFLAKKGLEVYEFRIESGLNCGGHAFASNGHLLPTLLQEFKEKRDELAAQFRPYIQKYYQKMGWDFPEAVKHHRPRVTVQGGIGTHGEHRRLIEDFGIDMTGWASPFLLVPEATCVDEPTRKLLEQAQEEDLYLSDVSPLGVPFNNVRRTGSEQWTQKRIEQGKPGSPCPKKFLVSNTEFTDTPICTASREYQEQKLAEIEQTTPSNGERLKLQLNVLAKTCICDHLGNGALIALGLVKPSKAPQAVCPGPNIAWFNRKYSLKEMVDHIYGRIASLVPPERPHMFAKEAAMYVDYVAKLIDQCKSMSEVKKLQEFRENLHQSIDFCRAIGDRLPYPDENLASITQFMDEQKARLEALFTGCETKINQLRDQFLTDVSDATHDIPMLQLSPV